MANYEGEIIENGLEFLAAADVFFAVFPDIIAKEIECDAPKPKFALVASELLEGCDEGFQGQVIRRGSIVDPRSEIATDPTLPGIGSLVCFVSGRDFGIVTVKCSLEGMITQGI